MLYHKYEVLSHQPDDAELMNAVLDSIEKRWAKTDQDVFIAALLLNPMYKASAFSSGLEFLTGAGVWDLISRLWTRFYKETPPISLFRELSDYFQGTGIYAMLSDHIEREMRLAESEVCPILPCHGAHVDLLKF